MLFVYPLIHCRRSSICVFQINVRLLLYFNGQSSAPRVTKHFCPHVYSLVVCVCPAICVTSSPPNWFVVLAPGSLSFTGMLVWPGCSPREKGGTFSFTVIAATLFSRNRSSRSSVSSFPSSFRPVHLPVCILLLCRDTPAPPKKF